MSAFSSLLRGLALAGASVSLSIFCVSSAAADESEQPPADLPILASGSPINEDAEGTTADINRVQRAEASTYTSLTWTLTNGSTGNIGITNFSNKVYRYNAKTKTAISGVSLIDEKSETRYYPLKDSNNICLCSGTGRGPKFHDSVKRGRNATYWNAFSIPEDVDTVTIEIPGFKPIKDIKIE
ncbi:MAG: hypothetical protein M0026_19725 [Nocardiopsaceae bacterium]|nr:hypothetical protein [Nocardiopsaceae bacterium]